MKFIRFFLSLAIMLVAFGSFQNASAQAFTYTSAYQVYNLESTQAQISILFYDQNGNNVNTVSDTINGNSSKTYFVVNQIATSFNGSIVIASSTQVASIANVHGNNYYANGSYVAQSEGNTTVQIPLLMKNNSGYTTWFNVQNTGSSDANVNVSYSDGTSVGPITIKSGAAKTFYQASEPHSTAIFAGTVTSTQPVVVTVIEENSGIIFAYNGFKSSSTNPVLPLVQANNSGYDSGVAVMNNGSTSTQVTITYTPSPGAGNGTQCTETQTIPAGQIKVYALSAFATSTPGSTCTPGARFVGSAKVTGNSANQPLTIVVNQHKRPINGGSYSGFNPAEATSRVIFPLIMDRNSGWWTGFNLQNVGSSNTTVSCTFTNTSYTIPATVLQPGQALNALQNNAIGSGYIGSATCTATGGDAKIIGVVNEARVGGTSDQLMTYEGINVTP